MNQLGKIAFTYVQQYMDAYKEQATKAASMGERLLTTKAGRDALDALTAWGAVQSLRVTDQMVTDTLSLANKYQAESYRRYFASFPIQLPEPWDDALGYVLGGGFNQAAMADISKWRSSEGFHLSQALWSYADDAQHVITDTVTRAVSEGWPYGKVQDTIGTALTEQGKQNYAFNIQRLYVNEVNTAWTCSRKVITNAMPFITQVELIRADDGDPTCEICNTAIGEPGAHRTVAKQEADLPPYHPFCRDSWDDVLPTADAMTTALKES